jgi:hypothetical protein
MEKCSKLDRVHYRAIDPGHEPRANPEGPERLIKWLRSMLVKTSVGIISSKPAFLTALQTCPML